MSFPLDKRKVDSWKSLNSEGVEGTEQVSKKSENKLFFNTIAQKHHPQSYFLKIIMLLFCSEIFHRLYHHLHNERQILNAQNQLQLS